MNKCSTYCIIDIREVIMIKIFKKLHRRTKLTVILGWAAVIIMLFASTLLYIGAGGMFDYYSAVDLSEKLLTLCRPAAVIACVASLGSEYTAKRRNGA